MASIRVKQHRKWMSRTARAALVAAVGSSICNVNPTSSQNQEQSASKAKIEKKLTETRSQKSAFSGNEFRVTAMNSLQKDCSGGPIPDIRVIEKPVNGELRIEAIRYVVNRTSDNAFAHCNGKEVDAMGLFYKSSEKFAGRDRITVDVDYKTGTVRRFIYTIDVR
jgi:hypothetical protein